jgi:hypothetical protein
MQVIRFALVKRITKAETLMDKLLPRDSEKTAFERHFTPKQLADLWLLDVSTIRRLFQDEPGVLKYGKTSRHDGRREYVTLRIPESVARRVYKRRTR